VAKAAVSRTGIEPSAPVELPCIQQRQQGHFVGTGEELAEALDVCIGGDLSAPLQLSLVIGGAVPVGVFPD